ncbi:MAG TPA: hypothetical protein VGY76_10200 [Solirubrobacteraceae bacterium]|nr:hypothetical protein [Solirubrobacteraceae bacterium]
MRTLGRMYLSHVVLCFGVVLVFYLALPRLTGEHHPQLWPYAAIMLAAACGFGVPVTVVRLWHRRRFFQ